MSARKVVVMGGGVAGLTVAHELLEKGFEVVVLERRIMAGGKARSFRSQPQTHGGKQLKFMAPVEHGFHFFPGFYKNLDDTLKKIEVGPDKTVFDALEPAPEELFGFIGRPPINVRSMMPETVADFQSIVGFPDRVLAHGLLAREDLEIFSQKLWQVATTCRARRETEYEAIGWRSYVGSFDRSEQYYWYLANGLTRALVAAQASKASTKTIGDVGMRILGQLVRYNGRTDRVLAGPADDVWFIPWLGFLKRRFGRSFQFKSGVTVAAIRCKGRRVEEVQLASGGKVPGDFFVSALPVEALSPLLGLDKRGSLTSRDPHLGGICTLAGGVDGNEVGATASTNGSEYLRWMSGIQFFLREKLDINRGHQMLLDTPWGLTSISQRQFWGKEFTDELDGNGVGTLLSVEISSWDKPGLQNKNTAEGCSNSEEVARETWYQMLAALPDQGLPRFEEVMGWYLDESVAPATTAPGSRTARKAKGFEVNREPVVVNSSGARKFRPSVQTQIENFFLAGDYLRTSTDLACMESANESGRLAANAVLAAAGVHADESKIITPKDPLLTAPLRLLDQARFERNLPWTGWDMGKWIVRGLGAAKKVTDFVFGEPPDGARAVGRLGSSERITARGQELPDRASWDPRLNDLQATVNSLQKEAGPQCGILLDAKQALDAARQSARFEQIRDRLAPPQRLVSANNRSDSLFARWRFFDSRSLSQGEVPIPFHVYDADTLVIHGRANLNYLTRKMQDTGLVPVRDQNGKGFVEIWIMDYPDTCVGPYQEAAIHVVAADKSTPKADRVYRRKDGFGCELPILDPEVKLFTLKVLLSSKTAIEYGEKLFGIPKDYVEATFERTGDARTFTFWEPGDRAGKEPIFSGTIHERGGLPRKLFSLAALTQAVGALEVARDTWQQIEMDSFTSTLVARGQENFQGACNGVVEILADYKISPELTEVQDDDSFQFEGPHEFARLLSGMEFKPLLLARDRHLRSVLYTRDWIHDPKRLQALAYATDAEPKKTHYQVDAPDEMQPVNTRPPGKTVRPPARR